MLLCTSFIIAMVGLTQCASPSWTVYVDNFENDFFQSFDDSLLYLKHSISKTAES